MADWKGYKIGELIKTANTGLDAIKRAPIVSYDSGIKCLRIQDISQNKSFQNWGFCDVTNNNFARFQLKKDDIILARTGATIGVNTIIKKDLNSVFNNGLIRIRVNTNCIIPEYLSYHFQSSTYRGFIESISGGTSTQPNMQINALLSFEIKVPPLPEQQAIAEVLSSLDDKIDLLHRQNKTLEAMAETLFRQWFVEEAEESWEIGKLGDVTENIRSNIQHTNIKEETNYVGLEHIERKHIALYSSGSSNQITSNKSVFQRHDTLFGKLRPYFHKVCFAPFGGVCSTDILVLRPKESIFFPYLLFAFFQKEVVDYSDLSSEGTRMPRTSWEILQQFPIAVPSRNAVLRFNEIALPAIQKIEQNINQIHKLAKLRDELLPKLMSGDEVKVKI